MDKHSKAVAEIDRAREVAREIWPLLEQIDKIAREGGITGYVRITTGEDGYADLELGDTEWEIRKFSGDPEPKMHFDWKELLYHENTGEDDKEDQDGTE